MKAALLVVCLAVIGAGTLTAQSSVPMPTRTVCGVVHGTDARPLDAANVFLIETLEGVVTHEDGRFTIQTTATGPLTIIVHRLGFSERRRLIAEGDTSTPVITLDASGVSLAPVAVQAGQCTAGEERGATLTPPRDALGRERADGDCDRATQRVPRADHGTGRHDARAEGGHGREATA